jgi:hypothetical protein
MGTVWPVKVLLCRLTQKHSERKRTNKSHRQPGAFIPSFSSLLSRYFAKIPFYLPGYSSLISIDIVFLMLFDIGRLSFSDSWFTFLFLLPFLSSSPQFVSLSLSSPSVECLLLKRYPLILSAQFVTPLSLSHELSFAITPFALSACAKLPKRMGTKRSHAPHAL